MTEAKAESDKCQKEREKRRKRYKFALVKWIEDWSGGYTEYAVEHKDVLRTWWQSAHEVICDDQPEKVLRGMLKLLKENEDE